MIHQGYIGSMIEFKESYGAQHSKSYVVEVDTKNISDEVDELMLRGRAIKNALQKAKKDFARINNMYEYTLIADNVFKVTVYGVLK